MRGTVSADVMTRRQWLGLLFGLSVLGVALGVPAAEGGAERAPSLSLGPVFSGMHDFYSDRQYEQHSIRDHLMTDLVSRYDCVVQMRARGSYISTERAIETFRRIREANPAEVVLPAAESMVALGFHQVYVENEQVITGYVYCATVATGRIVTNGFRARTVAEIPQLAAEIAARTLSLRKREAVSAPRAGRGAAARRWAVLPISRTDQHDASTLDRGLAIQLEVALLEELGAAQLVDRAALDRILLEHKLQAIGSSFDAQQLGKLAGADYLLMGQVGRWDRAMRVNLQVVEALTGSIVGGAVLSGVAERDLQTRVVDAARAMVRQPLAAGSRAAATAEMRRKEADLLTSGLWKQRQVVYHGASVQTFQISAMRFDNTVAAAEGAALLLYDDPAHVYRVLRYASDAHMSLSDWQWVPGMRGHVPRLEASRRAIQLLEGYLGGVTSTPTRPGPLVLRAQSLFGAGQVDRALELVEEHLRKQPSVEPGRTARVRGLCLWEKGRLEEGLAAIEKAEKLGVSVDLAPQSMRNILAERRQAQQLHRARNEGGEYGELAVLKTIFSLESKEQGVERAKWIRFLQLMEKLETPEDILRLKPEELLGKRDPGEAWTWMSKIKQEPRPENLEFLEVWLMQARVLQKTGRNIEAARKAKDALYSASSTLMGMTAPSHRPVMDEARRIIAAIEAEVGPVSEVWKTAAEVRDDFRRYAICLVPEQGIPPAYVPNIQNGFKEFFGPNVHILPPFTIHPEDRRPNSDTVLSGPALRRLMKDTPIPANAIWIAFIVKDATDVPYGTFRVNAYNVDVVSARDAFKDLRLPLDNPVMLSLKHSLTSDPPLVSAFARIHSRNLFFAFNYLFEPKEVRREKTLAETNHLHHWRCETPPCAFSTSLDSKGTLRRQMCEACQARFKRLDLEELHRDLMATMKKAGTPISPALP